MIVRCACVVLMLIGGLSFRGAMDLGNDSMMLLHGGFILCSFGLWASVEFVVSEVVSQKKDANLQKKESNEKKEQ